MMTDTSLARLIKRAILCAFFLTGSASLIHEIVWTRLLRLVFGNTTYAITTVLCVFMAGLAVGSYLGGRLIDRRSDALRVFAVLEGIVGLYCLLLPWLIDQMEPLYRLVYERSHDTPSVIVLVRFALCGVLLLGPATLMGATLPVLSRYFVRSADSVGGSVGMLYAVNTFGAVAGAATAGFLLIRLLGTSQTIFVASALNFAACITGLVLHRLAPPAPAHAADATSAPKTGAEAPASYGPSVLRAVLVAYGLSGFAALVYEIAWTRALSLLIGSSVYAFSMMLTAFILGLALGASVAARFVDRRNDPLRALAIILVAIGLSALAVVPFFERLPFFVTGLIARNADAFWSLHLSEFGVILLIMLVPTTLMGAAFPFVNRVYVRETTAVGRSVGAVYSGNTIGSIMGSFLGGFVLIPTLGIQNTLFVAASVNVLAGAWMLLLAPSASPGRRRTAAVMVIVLTALALVVTPAWDPARLSFGPFVQAKILTMDETQSAAALARIADGDDVLYHKEGVATTVTVKRTVNGVLGLYVNGKPDALSHGELSQQRLLAHLPLLLHPNPRDVLEIGLASGMTLAAAGAHAVEVLDCVEISRAVVEATRLFDAFNGGILNDDRVDVIVADGRNHLALSPSTYDVIISQPSNPWIAGVADLFTVEFFELCAERLRPSGVVCIWLETPNLDMASFRCIVRTFQSVFPDTFIWNAMGSADFMLIGSTEPLSMDAAVLAERMRREPLASSLREIFIETVPDLLSHMVMGPAGARRLAGDAPIHTDDNAHLEFSAPRSQPRQEFRTLFKLVEAHREADLSFLTSDAALRDEAALMIRARGHLVKDLDQDKLKAHEGYRQAAGLSPSLPGVRKYSRMNRLVAHRLAQSGDANGALALYRMLVVTVPTDPIVRYDLGTFHLLRGEHAAAAAQFDIAARLPPPAAGRLDETPAFIEGAIAAATAAGQTQVASMLRARLDQRRKRAP